MSIAGFSRVQGYGPVDSFMFFTIGSSQPPLVSSMGNPRSSAGSRGHRAKTDEADGAIGASCILRRHGVSSSNFIVSLGAWIIITPRLRAAVITWFIRGAIAATRCADILHV